METKLMILLFSFMIGLMGCSDVQHQPNAVLQVDVSCEEPPSSFLWGQQTYTLKTIGNRDLEPGMKLGYLDCKDGVYTQQVEGENSTFNIYTYGSPLQSDDLLYFGQWGRALYSPSGEHAKTSGEHAKTKKDLVGFDSSSVPHSVEVSFYKSGSPKGQPELINMYTDKSAPEKLKEFSSWIENSKSSTDIDASNVNRIYFIKLDFDNRTSRYYLCIHAKDKKTYLKQIQMDQVQNVHLDQFDSNLAGHLIEIAGTEGWMESAELPY